MLQSVLSDSKAILQSNLLISSACMGYLTQLLESRWNKMENPGSNGLSEPMLWKNIVSCTKTSERKVKISWLCCDVRFEVDKRAAKCRFISKSIETDVLSAVWPMLHIGAMTEYMLFRLLHSRHKKTAVPWGIYPLIRSCCFEFYTEMRLFQPLIDRFLRCGSGAQKTAGRVPDCLKVLFNLLFRPFWCRPTGLG